MSPNQKISSPTSECFVIFCIKWLIPNTNDESRTHMDELQGSLIGKIELMPPPPILEILGSNPIKFLEKIVWTINPFCILDTKTSHFCDRICVHKFLLKVCAFHSTDVVFFLRFLGTERMSGCLQYFYHTLPKTSHMIYIHPFAFVWYI